jgi:hypothetical protein
VSDALDFANNARRDAGVFNSGIKMRQLFDNLYATEWFRFFDTFGSRIIVYGMLIAILRNVWRGGLRFTRKSDVIDAYKRADAAEGVLRFMGWKRDSAGMWIAPGRRPAGWIAEDGTTQPKPDEWHDRPYYLE